jgi:DNA-binding MarR family transcriptional regulator
MPTILPFEQFVVARNAHRSAAFDAFQAMLALHGRLARLRTGATSGFGLTHARLRVLRAIATHPGACIAALARNLDLTRQAVHRVVHDLRRMNLLELVPSSRSARERVPKLKAAGRVASECGLRWERQWLEHLGESAETRSWQWLKWLAGYYRRHLPWRADDETPLDLPPRPPPGPGARFLLSPA